MTNGTAPNGTMTLCYARLARQSVPHQPASERILSGMRVGHRLSLWDTLAKLEQQAKEADEHGDDDVDEFGFEERAAALGQEGE